MHSAATTIALALGLSFGFGLSLGMSPGMSQAQAAEAVGQRWYQVEMTVFTHESSNLDLELWTPDRLSLAFPERLRRLRPVSDVLMLDDWSVLSAENNAQALATAADSNIPPAAGGPNVRPVPDVVVGPRPYEPAAAGEGFSMPDLLRDAFWELPAADHDFTNTNRALTQSSQHRILFHAAWRQPMTRLNAATPIAVVGGRAFNDRHELEGSLRLYFNNSEDRIILEPNLWFSTFGSSSGTGSNPGFNADSNGESAPVWQLPPLPEILQVAADNSAAISASQPAYTPTRIIQVNQTREARSNEFHYIDHPAIGVFIQLTPYEVPPPAVVEPQPALNPDSAIAPPLELQ